MNENLYLLPGKIQCTKLEVPGLPVFSDTHGSDPVIRSGFG